MKRVLVIDDDDLFRAMVCDTLRDAGYEVLEAPDGKAGLKVLKSSAVDMVVTDLFMPEKEGLETIRQIIKDHEAVRIIAISGGMRGSTMDFLPIAKILGAARVFHKPLDRKAFLAATRELLGEADSGQR